MSQQHGNVFVKEGKWFFYSKKKRKKKLCSHRQYCLILAKLVHLYGGIPDIAPKLSSGQTAIRTEVLNRFRRANSNSH